MLLCVLMLMAFQSVAHPFQFLPRLPRLELVTAFEMERMNGRIFLSLVLLLVVVELVVLEQMLDRLVDFLRRQLDLLDGERELLWLENRG